MPGRVRVNPEGPRRSSASSGFAPSASTSFSAASRSVDLQVEMELLRAVGDGHCGGTYPGAAWKASAVPAGQLQVHPPSASVHRGAAEHTA